MQLLVGVWPYDAARQPVHARYPSDNAECAKNVTDGRGAIAHDCHPVIVQFKYTATPIWPYAVFIAGLRLHLQ